MGSSKLRKELYLYVLGSYPFYMCVSTVFAQSPKNSQIISNKCKGRTPWQSHLQFISKRSIRPVVVKHFSSSAQSCCFEWRQEIYFWDHYISLNIWQTRKMEITVSYFSGISISIILFCSRNSLSPICNVHTCPSSYGRVI